LIKQEQVEAGNVAKHPLKSNRATITYKEDCRPVFNEVLFRSNRLGTDRRKNGVCHRSSDRDLWVASEAQDLRNERHEHLVLVEEGYL
jgi:hypothetical protein